MTGHSLRTCKPKSCILHHYPATTLTGGWLAICNPPLALLVTYMGTYHMDPQQVLQLSTRLQRLIPSTSFLLCEMHSAYVSRKYMRTTWVQKQPRIQCNSASNRLLRFPFFWRRLCCMCSTAWTCAISCIFGVAPLLLACWAEGVQAAVLLPPVTCA